MKKNIISVFKGTFMSIFIRQVTRPDPNEAQNPDDTQ